MKQADHIMAIRHLIQGFHHQLVPVGGNTSRGEHRGQLELIGSYLVVLGFGADSKFP